MLQEIRKIGTMLQSQCCKNFRDCWIVAKFMLQGFWEFFVNVLQYPVLEVSCADWSVREFFCHPRYPKYHCKPKSSPETFCPLKQSNELLSKEKWMNAKRKMDECESPRNINKSTVSLFVQPMTLRIWRLFPHIFWTLTLTLTLNFGLWWLQVQMTLQTWTNLNFKTPLSLWCFIKKAKFL